MLKIHQPYKSKYIFAFASIGVLLLGMGMFANFFISSSRHQAYAAGDSRTIHDIENMQDITQQICSNTEEGDTETLRDSRDPNSYTIVKLEDGNCWMQQNLRLIGGRTLRPSDSNVSSDWLMPASLTSLSSTNFSSSDYYKAESYYKSDTLSTNGVYYSFTAATAGAATSAVTSGEVGGVNGNSVCPRGWKLPINSEYENLLSQANIDNSPAGSTKIRGDKYKFPRTGDIHDGSLDYVNYGYYWSRTAGGSNYARYLYFSSNNVYMYNGNRYIGFPLRCLAPGGLEKIEKPLWTETTDTNVNVTMPAVITIDAASGMEEIADSSKVIEGTITATVSSNTNHTVTLHAAQPALQDPANSAEITPVSSANPVKPGNNAWGLWDGVSSSPKAYNLPITTSAQEFYNTAEAAINPEGNPATKHTYYVGISISPALPAGVYATQVTVTASAR